MPQVLHSEIAAGLLCPACDPRAIGLDDDGAQRWVYRHTLRVEHAAEIVFKCGACGCTFNPGTTRQYGPKTEPLTRAAVDGLIKAGDCTCGPGGSRMWRSFDLNYLDYDGTEERVHGFVCLHCGRWAQYG